MPVLEGLAILGRVVGFTLAPAVVRTPGLAVVRTPALAVVRTPALAVVRIPALAVVPTPALAVVPTPALAVVRILARAVVPTLALAELVIPVPAAAVTTNGTDLLPTANSRPHEQALATWGHAPRLWATRRSGWLWSFLSWVFR